MSAYKHLPADKAEIEVWTEGKTDWKLLKKAAEKLNVKRRISFHEFEDEMGDKSLLTRCKTFAERPNDVPMVFIFDRDNKGTVAEVSSENKSFRNWGNNVFSLAIPIPSHRSGYENISIEFYFKDNEIQAKDSGGRRLFLTSEFNEKSGKWLADPRISIGSKGQLYGLTEPLKAKVIDTEIYDGSNQNIALTKSRFTEQIINEVPPFDTFDFSEFQQIFEVLESIIILSKPKPNTYFPDLDQFFNKTDKGDISQQLVDVLVMIQKITTMGLQIFIATTIRCYEEIIVSEEPPQYDDKAKSIKRIIAKRCLRPSFEDWLKLAEKCCFLVDNTAPDELIKMKSNLELAKRLGDIGQLLDDLERLFPPRQGTRILMNKAERIRDLIRYVLPELAKHFDHTDQIEEVCKQHDEPLSKMLSTWQNALRSIVDTLEPMFRNKLALRTLVEADTSSGESIISVKLYSANEVSYYEETIPVEEVDNYRSNTTDLLLSESRAVHLFPFLLLKDDALYYYSKTLAAGYQYNAITGDRVYIRETKKKFNHAVFKTGSRQELFWTEVPPTTNLTNRIRANLPLEDLEDFVGRDEQLVIIKDEIIEIPNQNGIVYGPGGIGKTALMLQVSKKLLEETNKDNVLFDNIVWASAKSDYYDYVFNAVEQHEPQFRSLDSALISILKFFEFESLEEYDSDDKKELVLELLQENRVLLILDNFETIPPEEAERIIRFFNIDVKKRLRSKPGYFKVVITSRKQIPCGFHQIPLTGLDLHESMQLMEKLLKRYKSTKQTLTRPQQESIHNATKGIPIVIKHCLARIFEHNEGFDEAVHSLSQYDSEIIQFSFKEILEQIEVRDKEAVQLQIIILLELINYPLMIRQIADILGVNEIVIERRLPMLVDFQCLKKISQEKYIVNDEIRLLTRGLAQKHSYLGQQIRQKITRDFSIDKQMDYTAEEFQIISIFENYLSNNDYLEAEDFLKKQLRDNQNSILLNFHYARYLKERKQEINQAIAILENIRELSGNHLSILKLLVACYVSLDIPNFDKASVYVNEFEKQMKNDEDLKLRTAEFYVKWSTMIKQGKGLDKMEEGMRQDRYKKRADKAVSILNSINRKTHEVYYLLAQGYHNLWEYESARKMIDNAIESVEGPSAESLQDHYMNFRQIILEKQQFYSRFKWHHAD